MADQREPDPDEPAPAEKARRRLSIPSNPRAIAFVVGSLALIAAGFIWLFGGFGDPTVRGVAGAVPEGGIDAATVESEAVSTGNEIEPDPVIEAFSEDSPPAEGN